MSEDEIVFWDRAGNPEFEAWLKAAEAVVGEGNIQEVLHSDLAGSLHINPIYTDEMTDGSLDEVSEGVGLRSSNPAGNINCLLYTSPSPRDGRISRMPSSA